MIVRNIIVRNIGAVGHMMVRGHIIGAMFRQMVVRQTMVVGQTMVRHMMVRHMIFRGHILVVRGHIISAMVRQMIVRHMFLRQMNIRRIIGAAVIHIAKTQMSYIGSGY